MNIFRKFIFMFLGIFYFVLPCADYPNDHGSAFFNVPIKYDHKHRINMSFFCRNAVDFIKNGRLVDYNVQDGLTPDRVKEFYDILLHYFDFCQKNKFEKLRKVRDDQKRLPIFLYKEKIVSTIQENQVVVVAGDTGCGKSTQVGSHEFFVCCDIRLMYAKNVFTIMM